MNKTTLINQLTALGLEEKGARAYLACLELGGGSVLDISRLSRIERTACYSYVNDLVNRKLLYLGTQKKNTYYPTDPARLKAIIEEKQSVLSSLLPAISELYSHVPTRSRLLYFEGKSGIAGLYHQLESLIGDMEVDERVYAFSRLFEAVDAMPDMLTEFFNRRSNMSAQSMMILPASEKPPAKVKNFDSKLIETRYGAQIVFKRYLADRYMPTGMNTVIIARDHVATIDFKSLSGTITISDSFAQTWIGFHQYIWSTLMEK